MTYRDVTLSYSTQEMPMLNMSRPLQSLLSTFAGNVNGPVTEDIIQATEAAIPIGRIVDPFDVADDVLFLADPARSLLSGAEIRDDV
ncbi:hypothetical protein FOFC_20774 [Fusarium oxysporum]|nr:hypothetical protein FOFC_20774 [Fusarium oxysporum]